MVTKSCWKSWAAMICVHADQAADLRSAAFGAGVRWRMQRSFLSGTSEQWRERGSLQSPISLCYPPAPGSRLAVITRQTHLRIIATFTQELVQQQVSLARFGNRAGRDVQVDDLKGCLR